ncbi:MAG: BON domain-containing protein [Pseudomonadota bacterium]
MTQARAALVLSAALLIAGVALAASTTGAAQTKADQVAADLSLKETAIARVLDARAGFFADVEIDIFSGDALLTGRVATVQEKAQATALVRSVPGIQTVTNEIQVGAVGDVKRMTNDLILERQIRKEMRAVFGKRMPRLSWRATNGVVYVFGHARTEWEHNRTLALVKKIRGTTRVVDLLRITTAGG